MGIPPALPRPQEPHLGREVDAGSTVEEQLGYVEVLVMSCDVEGGESRLGHNSGQAALYYRVLSFLPRISPGSEKLAGPEDPTGGQIWTGGVIRHPTASYIQK